MPAVPEIDQRRSREWPVEVFRQAHAHEARHGNDDVDVAGEIAVEEERINNGQPTCCQELDRHRQGLRHLRECIDMHHVEQHRDHIDLDEAAHNAFQL